MAAAEPSEAALRLSSLTEALHSSRTDGFDLDRAWEGFQRLLERRGYFVATPSQLEASLAEIKTIGPGFDLYDLARNLALYDIATTKCVGLTKSRVLPVLRPFARTCDCSNHRKET